MKRSNLLLLLFLACCPLAHAADESSKSTWTSGKKMPTQRSEIACAVVGGKIYLSGGVSHRGSLRAFEAYDIALNTWEKRRRLPKKLNHSGVAAHGDQVYVSGGFENLTQGKRSDQLYAYDTRHDQWRSLGSMPGTRVKHFMIQRKGWLHMIGGLDTEEIWSYEIASGNWRKNLLPPLPEKRDHISVLQEDAGTIYVVGGRRDKILKSDCWRLLPGGRNWETFTTLPTPRGGQMAALANGKIHVTGGEDQIAKVTLQSHDIYDLRKGTWSEGAPLPSPRHGSAFAEVEGKWYVIGGGRKAYIQTIFSTTRTVEIFDLR